ncbi:MAG TPA: dTDP-4-dehydrorhamnose 3,5-epimerase [Terracidiphilus sp.]|jgi:dTDP-4-dehydrorhamnose 3,5-epimerase|nr:dTDP-4-dehydrorhamnose 3,5-epimerase [Terracidiphilus sp.]
MKIEETALPGVLLLTPKIFADVRGAFWEVWNRGAFEEAGLSVDWVQDNCSYSARNVLRGIHYQVIQQQIKLVRAMQGTLMDVAVDLRRSSPHFGQSVAVELTAESGRMLYIPAGFGHGFVAVSETTGLAYKVSDYYCREGERTILWSDPELAIPWPVEKEDAILSEKDRNAPMLRDAEVFP